MNRRVPIAVLALALATVLLVAARPRIVAHPEPVKTVSGPTFDNEVVRIFQQNCQSCHHPGDIAPFSLMSYGDAAARADAIKYMTSTKQMPPWKPSPGCGDFEQARVLKQDEIDTIVKWVDNGAPEGNAADLPTPLDFSSGWAMGQPDMVLSYPESYTPPATGDMYRCFPLPTNLTSDRYVSAIDIHPGDRASVHHVIAYIDTNNGSQALDDNDSGPGYTSFGGPGFSVTNPNAASLGGWAPGSRPVSLPEGVAYSLPAASKVVLQVHYHPHDGKPKADRTEIGIYFAKTKPKQLLRVIPIINDTFTIPPNNPNYLVTASLPIALPVPTHLWIVAPHMHLLGHKMSVTAALPNGTFGCLINIDDWDFNWQGLYRYKNAVALPAGTRLSLGAYYDNSAGNWRNPNDPPQSVSWGESTTDEMCIAFVGITIDGENLAQGQTVDTSWLKPLVRQ
jgi:hypothetical protein